VIFDVLRVMMSEGKPIDLLMVGEALKKSGRLDEVGSSTFLERLVDGTPTAAHAEYYIDIVRQKHLLRMVIDRSRKAIDECYSSEEDAEIIRGKIEAEFAGLQHDRGEIKSPGDLLETQIKRWEQARETGCAGTPTGFRIFDRYFGGLMDGAYYVFSGEPGTGKTTLARNLAENLVMRGIPAAFFTLEQTAEQIWGSVAARHAKQSVFLLNRGSRGANLVSVAQSAIEVQGWPLYVDDTMHTPVTLWSAARRMVSKFGCRLIVLDYLQQLMPDRKYGSQEEMTTAFSATCRQIAKVLKVPVLALCALSNEGRTRGSGMIGYDAWAHIRLTKSDEWTEGKLVVDVHFDKQRFGPPAQDEKLTLIGDEQRFEEEPICPDRPAPNDFQDTDE
jgi:replicative DNA helicase